MSLSFQWDKSPADIGNAIARRFGPEADAKLLRVVDATGIDSAGHMKRTRPWRDISGNARSGLRCEAESQRGLLTLYLVHSVEYGKDLELGHAGRYAVIVPTLHSFTVPRLQRRLKGSLK